MSDQPRLNGPTSPSALAGQQAANEAVFRSFLEALVMFSGDEVGLAAVRAMREEAQDRLKTLRLDDIENTLEARRAAREVLAGVFGRIETRLTQAVRAADAAAQPARRSMVA